VGYLPLSPDAFFTDEFRYSGIGCSKLFR